jgi:hypothetical protein
MKGKISYVLLGVSLVLSGIAVATAYGAMSTEREYPVPVSSVILYVDDPLELGESEFMAVLYFEEDSPNDSCSNCMTVSVTIANKYSITYQWGTTVTTVYPGHGPKTTVGAERRGNPFLT